VSYLSVGVSVQDTSIGVGVLEALEIEFPTAFLGKALVFLPGKLEDSIRTLFAARIVFPPHADGDLVELAQLHAFLLQSDRTIPPSLLLERLPPPRCPGEEGAAGEDIPQREVGATAHSYAKSPLHGRPAAVVQEVNARRLTKRATVEREVDVQRLPQAAGAGGEMDP
jgi:hypothetical protein